MNRDASRGHISPPELRFTETIRYVSLLPVGSHKTLNQETAVGWRSIGEYLVSGHMTIRVYDHEALDDYRRVGKDDARLAVDDIRIVRVDTTLSDLVGELSKLRAENLRLRREVEGLEVEVERLEGRVERPERRVEDQVTVYEQ